MSATEPKPVHQALAAVMRGVTAVAKRDHNNQGGYSFRGIDAVVNAVGPVLREHGVIVVPIVESSDYSTVEVGRNRTQMGYVRVTVTYRWYGPDGDHIDTRTIGEAMDSGDKAAPKAMSVAFRTALLQALALPTDEPDPDAHTYERASAAPDPTEDQRASAAPVPTEDQVEQHVTFRREIQASTLLGLAALVGEIKAAAEAGRITPEQNRLLAGEWQQRKAALDAEVAGRSTDTTEETPTDEQS